MVSVLKEHGFVKGYDENSAFRLINLTYSGNNKASVYDVPTVPREIFILCNIVQLPISNKSRVYSCSNVSSIGIDGC